MCWAVLCCAMLCCAVLCAVQCHAWLCCSALGWCPPNGLLLLSCCFAAAYCSAVLLACYCAPLCCDVLRCSGLLCSALLCCAVLCCDAAVLCCALQCFAALCCCCCCACAVAAGASLLHSRAILLPKCAALLNLVFWCRWYHFALLRYASFGILEVYCMNTSPFFCG